MLDLSSMTSDLDRIAIDPGSSFLSGGATSLFSGKDVTVGRLPNPFKEAVGNMPDKVALASQLVNMIVSDVTSFAASYLGQKLGDLLTPPTISDVIALEKSYLADELKSSKQILEEVSSEAEDNIESTSEEETNEQLSSSTENINEKSSELKKDVNKNIEECKKWAQTITSYICQGPKWVTAQANMIDKRCCEEIEKQIADQTKKLKDQKQETINSLAKKSAKRKATVINEKNTDAAYQKLKKVKQEKAKAKNQAASQAKKALLALKASLGM